MEDVKNPIQFSSNPKHQNNPLLLNTFRFAVDIAEFCDDLDELKKFNLSRQLFRSGTSIGANSREAQNAESRADFVHKLKIALKEAEETEFWLFLCKETINSKKIEPLLKNINGILKLLNSIVGSAKNNAR